MKRKVKKMLLAAVLLGGVTLLVCGGLIGVVASGVLPGVWNWTRDNAVALASLHPDTAEFVQSLQALQVIDPGLRSALDAMGQATLEPEALLAQLAAAAVPAAALDGLSPAEMNAKLAEWGVPLRVTEPAAASAPTTTGDEAANADTAAEPEPESEVEPGEKPDSP